MKQYIGRRSPLSVAGWALVRHTGLVVDLLLVPVAGSGITERLRAELTDIGLVTGTVMIG
jgi:hypothetical protein